MKTVNKILFVITFGLLISSCKKEASVDPRDPTPYYVTMTDAPAAYSAVNVDVMAVEIKGNAQTVSLNINAGVYNLLDFTNGLDTLIASGSLYIQHVQEIRLILGNNNTVVKNGITYPLSTPSAQQSGLKIKVNQTLQPGIPYYVLLDFDANASIVDQGNGSFSLKPVIRAIEVATSGSISGQVNPSGVAASIVATSGTNSYSTMANVSGYFMLPGVPPGIYDVTVTPSIPYNPVTIHNIAVSIGGNANIGTVNL
ncbi:MAG: DUF4382 domain-containing protein [Bacteroidota bacterium]